MANKRKTTTAIVAGVTAAALVLGGTFAWTSISQQAKNEAIVDINPGGRLHDDFNGTNKDVYVENFSSGATGVDIFARIRLDQYFEVGQEAGINKDGETRKVNQILGTDINDESTWVTYKPGDTLGAPIQANDNWQWTLGNDDTNMPVYMPTFNMNKDSLVADINGTYEGTIEGDVVHYDDYKTYTEGQTAEGTEVYDWDDDDNVEEENPDITYDETTPRDSVDVYHKSTVIGEDGTESNLTHTAKPISSTAEVISMAQWLERLTDGDTTNDTGAYWVYDTDGWAYWAQPIAPETTTGLLLDGINMSRVPDDNWYYGINVVGQFATAGDWELLYSTTGSEKDAMTDGAKQLMELITGIAPAEDGGEDDNTLKTLTLIADGTNSVEINSGDSVSIAVDETGLAEGQAADITALQITYTGLANDTATEETEITLAADQYTYADNVLTITDTTLAGETFTVKDSNRVVSGTLTVTAASTDPENPSVEVPTYYTMDVAYPLESGTTVNLGVEDYTDETPDTEVSYYIINKTNNPDGGSATELEAKDSMKVVPLTFETAGGLLTEISYYYAVPFTNGSTVTTTAAVEGITLVAMDGDTVVAYTCTKVYDATVHTYLGVGNYKYTDPETNTEQNVGCLVFESKATTGNYCTLGDANVGVDGDDAFKVTTGVTAAAEGADYDYDVTNITETACTCTASTT